MKGVDEPWVYLGEGSGRYFNLPVVLEALNENFPFIGISSVKSEIFLK